MRESLLSSSCISAERLRFRSSKPLPVPFPGASVTSTRYAWVLTIDLQRCWGLQWHTVHVALNEGRCRSVKYLWSVMSMWLSTES